MLKWWKPDFGCESLLWLIDSLMCISLSILAHTFIYVYLFIYIYIYIYVCVCVCVSMGNSKRKAFFLFPWKLIQIRCWMQQVFNYKTVFSPTTIFIGSTFSPPNDACKKVALKIVPHLLLCCLTTSKADLVLAV